MLYLLWKCLKIYPENTDGEVNPSLLPAEEVLKICAETSDFKFNCSLVNIDFFIRHGILGLTIGVPRHHCWFAQLKKLITKSSWIFIVNSVRRIPKLRLLVTHRSTPHWYRQVWTLLYLILEQQVSLASARALGIGSHKAREPSPETFLTLSDQQLRDVGLSRQKIHYGRTLAEAVLTET